MNSCTWLWAKWIATKECFCMKSQRARFHNRPHGDFSLSTRGFVLYYLHARWVSVSGRGERESCDGEEKEDEEEKKNLGADKLVKVFENSAKNLIRLNGLASARSESRKRFLCDRISSQTTSERFVSLFLLSARRIESAPMAMTCHISCLNIRQKAITFMSIFSSLFPFWIKCVHYLKIKWKRYVIYHSL